MKVVFVGNSVPLRVRPPVGHPFPVIFENKIDSMGYKIICSNESKGATLISDAIKNIDNQVIAKNPNIVVINFGINEACTRLLPKKLDDWIFYKSRVYLSKQEQVFAYFVRIVRKLLNVIRPYLIKILRLTGWSTALNFKRLLRLYIEDVIKETGATCVLITIPHISNRVEKLLPGSKTRIVQFNKKIIEVSKELNVKLIDINEYLNGKYDEYIPEGIHYNSKGHNLVAELLTKELFDTITKVSGKQNE